MSANGNSHDDLQEAFNMMQEHLTRPKSSKRSRKNTDFVVEDVDDDDDNNDDEVYTSRGNHGRARKKVNISMADDDNNDDEVYTSSGNHHRARKKVNIGMVEDEDEDEDDEDDDDYEDDEDEDDDDYEDNRVLINTMCLAMNNSFIDDDGDNVSKNLKSIEGELKKLNKNLVSMCKLLKNK